MQGGVSLLLSLSAEQAEAFVGPLLGKTTTFLVEGREANLAFARTAVAVLTRTKRSCAVLDLDALYSSNADAILGSLPGDSAKSATFTVPDPESEVEWELPRVISSDADVVIIDSFNTLYHLLSYADGSSRGRKLSFAVASMSYLARTTKKAIILTMYGRGGSWRHGTRSISDLSDVTVAVRVKGSELTVSCERGQAWPERRLSIRIP
jgi:hypothetical protein